MFRAGEAPVEQGEYVSMPIQYVRVSYPTRRLVYVDDEKSGYTNEVLRIGEGTHSFDLGPRRNYRPESRRRRVSGTTVQWPLELRFEPWEVA